MLKSVVEKFGVLMGAHRGEIELVVISAAVRQPNNQDGKTPARMKSNG